MADAKICSVEGCCNKSLARGFCSKHWQRWRRHGDPLKGAANRLSGECAVPGCERKPHTRWKGETDLCNRHWLRLYTTGSVDLREKVFASWAVCSVDGCDKDARTAGGKHCEMHYARLRRYGSFDLPDKPDVRYAQSAGYVIVSRPGHPLAKRGGTLYEHRLVLFEAIGAGTHQCHWCRNEVDWGAKGSRKLVVDHLDGDKTNNRPDNLVASCHRCNASRGLFQSWVMQHKDDPFLWALYRQSMAA